jgi:hypothetical protein
VSRGFSHARGFARNLLRVRLPYLFIPYFHFYYLVVVILIMNEIAKTKTFWPHFIETVLVLF